MMLMPVFFDRLGRDNFPIRWTYLKTNKKHTWEQQRQWQQRQHELVLSVQSELSSPISGDLTFRIANETTYLGVEQQALLH